MATIKEGTLHVHPMKHTIPLWMNEESAISCAGAQEETRSASENGTGQDTDEYTGAGDGSFTYFRVCIC
ncbi:MAG: hypothetical protein LUF27_07305 [Lachnospiraceae bacterium]|nr:hypothetical protein [Lachnospiraceae bacterium]